MICLICISKRIGGGDTGSRLIGVYKRFKKMSIARAWLPRLKRRSYLCFSRIQDEVLPIFAMIAEGYREAAVRHGKAQSRLRTDQIILRLEPFCPHFTGDRLKTRGRSFAHEAEFMDITYRDIKESLWSF